MCNFDVSRIQAPKYIDLLKTVFIGFHSTRHNLFEI